MKAIILIYKFMVLAVLSGSILLLVGCLGKKQEAPLIVSPIVVPAGVPPVKNHDYYEDIPAIPVVDPHPKPVSLLPPGSLISKEQQKRAKS